MAKTKKEPDWVKNPPKGFKVSKGKKRDLQMAIEDAKLGYGDTAGAEQWIEAGPDGDWIGYVLVPDKSTKDALEKEVQKASQPTAAGADATQATIGDSTGKDLGVSTSSRGAYSEEELEEELENIPVKDLKQLIKEIATEEIEAPPTIASETVGPPPTMASEQVGQTSLNSVMDNAREDPEMNQLYNSRFDSPPTAESEQVRGPEPKDGIRARLADPAEMENLKRQMEDRGAGTRPVDGFMGGQVGSQQYGMPQAMGEQSGGPATGDQAKQLQEIARGQMFDTTQLPPIAKSPQASAEGSLLQESIAQRTGGAQQGAGEQGLLDKWKSVLSGESEFSAGGLSEEDRAAFAEKSRAERMQEMWGGMAKTPDSGATAMSGADPVQLMRQGAPGSAPGGGPGGGPLGTETGASVPLSGPMGRGMGHAQHGLPQAMDIPKPPLADASNPYSSPEAEQRAKSVPGLTAPSAPTQQSFGGPLGSAVQEAFNPPAESPRADEMERKLQEAMGPMRNFNWNQQGQTAPPPAPGPQMPNEREMRGQALMDSMANRAQAQKGNQAQGTDAQQALESQMTQNDSGGNYQQSRAFEQEGREKEKGGGRGIMDRIKAFVDKGADTPVAKYGMNPQNHTPAQKKEIEEWMEAGRPNEWPPKKGIGRRPKLTGSLR